jgi:transcriptional regulator with GAF, ATPase, and Fis domain/tetratricopeptide (TPR) repeat protein
VVHEEETSQVVQYLIYYPPPISLDALISLTGLPAVTVLRAIERLKGQKVIVEKGTYGKGFYFINSPSFVESERRKLPVDDEKGLLQSIICLYAATAPEGRERTIALAELYTRLGGNGREGFEYVKNAADLQVEAGDKERAASFFDFLSKVFMAGPVSGKDAAIFVGSVLGKISLSGHLIPLREQIVLLRKAVSVAKRNGLWGAAARVCLNLGYVLRDAGDYKEAFRNFDEGRRLARQVGDARLLKEASISLSGFLFWKGQVAEAVRHYEEAIGDVEDFGDDESTLKGVATVGRCYVICGRVVRGIGLIDAVRLRAQSMQMREALIYADLMKILSLVDIRNTIDAEACLEKLFSYPEDVLGHYVLWAAHSCQAFVLFSRNRFEEAFSHVQRGIYHSRILGLIHHRGPWNFEMFHVLESKGFRDDIMNYDSEIERILGWDDIYMRGVALRYRALKEIGAGSSASKVLADLKASELYLKKAGAQIELARTRLALGRHYIERGETRRAQTYLERAWELFSKINKQLFPEELMTFLSQGRRVEIIMERTISIGETLGAIQDRSLFLDKMINLAMDVALATRGGFFVLTEKGEVTPIASRNLDPESLSIECSGTIRAKILEVIQKGDEGAVMDGMKEGDPSRKTDIDSLICIQVRLGKQVYGYLYLDSRLDGAPFTGPDLLYVRFLSKQIAIGLSNLASREEIEALKERFMDEALFYKKELGISAVTTGIVGESDAMKRIMALVSQVAATDSTILITGETGVGKSLIAKAIHNTSLRRDAPFIQVNLAAIPQELVPSELFGYEKGAFTGAMGMYKGRFELAHGGTIFLDEIGDLPNEVQIKLLGVLQERVFQRLGSSRPISSEFRVVAATNRDLHHKVETGVFRQDLYYRLNVFPIHIPPLRERREDISSLALHFLREFAKKMGKDITYIPESGLDKLLSYDWPGNVRELEHYIERAVILTDSHSRALSLPEIAPVLHQPRGRAQLLPLDQVEREHIEKALAATGWKVSGPGGAATILGLNPKTLFSRMGKLGIVKPYPRTFPE